MLESMTNSQSLVLAVVEGLTEYLPVSSTGHIIMGSWLMGINQEDFVKDYTVMVQFGAILSVVFLYWRRFILNFKLYPKVFLAFLPAAVIGLAVKNHIDALLGSVWVVAVALFIGGILLVLTDRWLKTAAHRKTFEGLTPGDSLKIGFFQVLAFIPGFSRSAATIWGGLFQGLNLELATEFSFFLAVPTLTGASVLKLHKVLHTITPEQWKMLLYGNIVSFVIGALAVKGFVRLISRYGLKGFGYYRIAVGLAVMIILALGYDVQVV